MGGENLVRGSRLAAALLVVATLTCAVSVPAAPAETLGHTLTFSFGEKGSGNGQFGPNIYDTTYGWGIAIHQESGDVWATDGSNHRVMKFDAKGNFIETWGFGVKDGQNEYQVCKAPSVCQQGISGAAPGQFRQPSGIAVDNSGGPNDGQVYVADTVGPAPNEEGLNYILRFDENGNFMENIDGTGTPDGPFESGELPFRGAVSLDNRGYLWITREGRKVFKVNTLEEAEYTGGSQFEPEDGGIGGVGVNGSGSQVYVSGYGIEGGALFRYSPSGTGRELVIEGGRFSPTPTFGVDSVTASAYVVLDDGIAEFNRFNEQVSTRFGSGVMSSPIGVAVNSPADTVYVTDGNQFKVFAFGPRVVPDLTTGPAIETGHTSVQLTGETAPDPFGGGNVVDCHFDYVDNAEYEKFKQNTPVDQIYEVKGKSAPCAQATPYAASTAVTADLSGLATETTYRYRLVASNATGPNKGEERTFTPHAVLGLITEPATDITRKEATLHATLDPDNDGTHYYFEWGTDTTYGHTTSVPPGEDAGSAPGPKAVFAAIAELDNYTTYHYRVVATNSLGTSYGNDETVRTLAPIMPTVGGTYAKDVTADSALVGAEISPGFGETTYRFDYGPGSSFSSVTLPVVLGGDDDGTYPATALLTGLTPGTTYEYRVIANNFGGTAHGPTQSFTTQAAPKILNTSVSAVTASGSTLHSTVNPGLSPTTVQFQFGTTTAYGATASAGAIGADDSNHPTSAAVSGLAPATTYHFRAVASNGIGETAGPDQVFKTAPAAPLALPPPPAPKCKKGFVKKRGKCVKRKVQKKKKRGASSRGAGK